MRNNAVYHSLSAKLASFGFTKSPQKCKEKIKKLKQDYRKIRRSQNTSWRRTSWFGILDEVLGSQPAASKYSEAPKLFSAEATSSMLDVESNGERTSFGVHLSFPAVLKNDCFLKFLDLALSSCAPLISTSPQM